MLQQLPLLPLRKFSLPPVHPQNPAPVKLQQLLQAPVALQDPVEELSRQMTVRENYRGVRLLVMLGSA